VIENEDVQVQGDTRVALGEILADRLSGDI
jgi:hypothetical protein